MKHLLKEIRHNPLLWLLAFVPATLACQKIMPESHVLLFILSVLAIVPLATLPSHASESVAAKNRLDLSVCTALGSASQIALFVAPVLVLMVYLIFAMTLYLLPPQSN